MAGQVAEMEVMDRAFGQQTEEQADARLLVRFYMHPVQNEKRTAEEGRPIFEDKEFVEIRIPGDKDNTVVRKVRDTDRQRFASRYFKFKNGQAQALEGTPLEHWPLVTKAQIEELKYFNVHTVEHLATMPDSAAQNFMGISLLRQRAQAYLEAAKSTAPFTSLQAQIEQKDAKINSLEATLAELAARVAAMESTPKKGKAKDE